MIRRRILGLAMGLCAVLLLTGCDNDAKVASRNLSQAADNFEITRRVVFINGITDQYVLSVQGNCSVDNGTTARSVAVTCKVGPGIYKKHLLGLSDNMTYFVEQLEPAAASISNYRVTFKPSVIIPDINVR